MPGSNTITLDSAILGWLVAACGSLIVFLLGLAVKDIKDKLYRSEVREAEFLAYKVEAERDRGELRRIIAELNGEVVRLGQRIEDMKRHD